MTKNKKSKSSKLGASKEEKLREEKEKGEQKEEQQMREESSEVQVEQRNSSGGPLNADSEKTPTAGQSARKEGGTRETLPIPVDIARGLASVWSGALREMQRRGIVDKDSEFPTAFRAEALGDGSLLLRAIMMPSGIVMVGDEGTEAWKAPAEVSKKKSDGRQTGGVSFQPEPGFKTLFIPEKGDVEIVE